VPACSFADNAPRFCGPRGTAKRAANGPQWWGVPAVAAVGSAWILCGGVTTPSGCSSVAPCGRRRRGTPVTVQDDPHVRLAPLSVAFGSGRPAHQRPTPAAPALYAPSTPVTETARTTDPFTCQTTQTGHTPKRGTLTQRRRRGAAHSARRPRGYEKKDFCTHCPTRA